MTVLQAPKKCEACKNGAAAPFPFSMAFQPIVDIDAGRIFAYEALVRGVGGESAFSVLSKVTDENRYAFDQACRVTAIKLAKRLGLEKTSAKLSINFMPGAVYNPAACIQLTLATARQVSFPLDRLIFEITEGEEVKDRAHLRSIFDEYRRHGFQMALDDFGAGFCGFNLFADLTPDILKLDMALARDIHKRSVALAAVSSLVDLCKNLGVLLIAEGIETKEEYYALRSCDIRFMQGYLFAQPAFEALPSYSIPDANPSAEKAVVTEGPLSLSLLRDTIRRSAQQVPLSFVLPGLLDWECLNRLTKAAAINLVADGAFILLNDEGTLNVVCQFGDTGATEVKTLQFVVDSGPARGTGCVISHSVADRTTLATIALEHEGEFLGVLGVSKRSSGAVTPAQECVLQTLGIEISAELARERRGRDSPKAELTPDASTVEQQLRMLQAVVVHANDSVLITEAEPIGEPGPRIVYANPAFTRLTGYTTEEVLGKTPRLLQGPESGMEARAKIREALSQWKPIEVELLNYRKDGSEFWVELSISPVADASGWYTHWVSVQRDITQRKDREKLEAGRAQSVLVRAEAFAAAGRLAATIAHEINNPLEAVTNLIYLAKTTKGITEELAGMLSLADQELTRLGKIARQTLGYYWESAHAEIVDVGELMSSTAAVYAALLASKQIRLEHQIATDQKVFATPGDLKQVFSNLLLNAIDATPRGGRIVLRVHPDHAGPDRTKGIRAVIADSGEGMSTEVKAKAFSAFFTTKGERGSGIGLWVTKSLVEKGGGTIRCRSKQGVRSGTSMSVFIPADRRI